uniref:Uncharacterized protein n=1 Tax=viral metagenome TaxID=1070528 RepID=A0A6C0HBM2_9ZZZZ
MEFTSAPAPLTKLNVQFKSLYIPVLPKDMSLDGEHLFDESSLKNYFEEKIQLGKVNRIDYVEKKLANNSTNISAFVHFDMWYETAENMLYDLKEESEIRLNGYWTPNRRQYINIRSKNNSALHRYFAVRINKTPIPEVKVPELNIHQLIASNKFMENLIEEQKIKMEAMEEKIRILSSLLQLSEESKNETMKPLTMEELNVSA